MLSSHIFVCTNQKSGVGEAAAKALRKELKVQGLKSFMHEGEKHHNRVQTCDCLDRCKQCKKGNGAALVVYPGGTFYGNVEPRHAARLVREHLAGGRLVADLLLPSDH